MSTSTGKTFQQLVAEAKQRIQEITTSDLVKRKEANETFLLLDVREPSDFAESHIPGAVNIARGLLELEINDVQPVLDAPIIVYCGGGSRSALAVETLQTMGYTQAVSLTNGYRGWKNQHH